jgi:hypothetical protein
VAVLARRTWANLRDEALQRLGRPGDTLESPRVEQYLAAAQYDLGILYHHPELDEETTTATASTSTNLVALPASTYVVIAVTVRTVGTGAFLKSLTNDSSWFNIKSFAGRSKAPDSWCRFGNSIYFDTIPDQAYPLTIWRYKEPTAPDFAGSATPALGRPWDEHILEYAAVRAAGGHWAGDLQNLTQPLLSDFLAKVAQPALADSPLIRLGPHPTRAATHGGAQG